MGKIAFKSDAHSLITPEAIRSHRADARAPADDAELVAKRAQLELVLEIARQGFAREEPAASVVSRLASQLHDLRIRTEPAIWGELIATAQKHPVAEYLLQDPFTAWSYAKPRGYAGDAGLIDFLYKHPSVDSAVSSASALGRDIYAYTSDAETSKAGRERRTILAETVDATAARVHGAEVLAIACGHMRETELSQALKEGGIKRWIGLDQDPISVVTVNANRADAVSAIEGSVRGILRRSYDLGSFDLVYAAGLFDYLPRKIGIRLVEKAVELLKPGGEFLFANFSDEITTDGYMESFMDWPLILRSSEDLLDIAGSAIDTNQFTIDVFYGANRNIVYGRVVKKAE